jgi:hypothetical protein
MSFFIPLNILICLWEISLGLQITYINKETSRLNTIYTNTNGRYQAVIDFFTRGLSINDIFSSKYWCILWSIYSIYDSSYSNKESFGFFIDVGNGWTTIIPSLLFIIGLTYDIFNPKILGIIGIIQFYQEFYGTIIYFLSFLFNERYKGKKINELLLFVGFTNGLWMIFPLIGMYISIIMIMDNNYDIVRI